MWIVWFTLLVLVPSVAQAIEVEVKPGGVVFFQGHLTEPNVPEADLDSCKIEVNIVGGGQPTAFVEIPASSPTGNGRVSGVLNFKTETPETVTAIEGIATCKDKSGNVSLPSGTATEPLTLIVPDTIPPGTPIELQFTTM